MLAVWSLLLLGGLVTPCHGLLETVGTLARIDKDELGKGELEVIREAITGWGGGVEESRQQLTVAQCGILGFWERGSLFGG